MVTDEKARLNAPGSISSGMEDESNAAVPRMITAGNFIVAETLPGYHAVKWRHNNAGIRVFTGDDSLMDANRYVRWLVRVFNYSAPFREKVFPEPLAALGSNHET